MAMQVPELYHGTSSFFAAKLLQGSEVSPLQTSGIFACASDLYSLIVKTAGSFTSAAMLYPIDSGVGAVAPLALKNVHEGYDASLTTYGAFYASLNPHIARSYAARNPQGSELLRFVEATISALRSHGVNEVDHLLGKYPELDDLLLGHHRPVVLQIHEISIDRLLEENGRSFSEESIKHYHELSAMGVRVPGSVRIAGPIAPYVHRAFRVLVAEGAAPSGFISDDDLNWEELSLNELRASA